MRRKQKTVCVSRSPEQTKKTGLLLARSILQEGLQKNAIVLALRGDLGAGKTTFTQGFAKGLGIRETVNSPTFVILKKYLLSGAGGFKNFYHIDCYRLNGGADFEQLGMEEILKNPANIAAVEWPQAAGERFLEGIIWINFESVDSKERRIVFER